MQTEKKKFPVHIKLFETTKKVFNIKSATYYIGINLTGWELIMGAL